MILYRLLRALGRLALRWFYRDIEVIGAAHFPATGPVLVASNHPNALVDALVIACTLDRHVTLTAKATLMDHPVTRMLMRAVGVVPLRRASDERARVRNAQGQSVDVDLSRNEHAFAAVLDVLRHGGVVLLFPEGKSHSEPALAPLKTGLARIALMARDQCGIDQLPIVPIGLTFERKWEPRTRVVMSVGAPITAEVPNDVPDVAGLTERIDLGLRGVTLNFRTEEDARWVLSISRTLAEILDDFRPLHAPDPPFRQSVRLAQRVDVIASRLPRLDLELATRVDRFLERLDAFEDTARVHAVSANDVQMTTAIVPGIGFVVRELVIALLAGPLALWGRVNHWVPLRLARWMGVRTSRTPDEPAMHTMVAGVVLVLAFYLVQTTVATLLGGWAVGLLYAVSLPVSASWDLRYADRRRRAAARLRTYLRLRRDPVLHSSLVRDVAWLRSEALSLNEELERDTDALDDRQQLAR